ncbi:hypothetical protein CYY_001067 [Polysphondylium violaceum]|uniref:Uncharacterized protein n=1 Tax=Polysphondylium violaceum TaxID=133409 RepID=A0A8J4Q3T0_9MYCE|nr:hypothetical protein CYY_001067 [Polysphondylium violaceum]
MLTNKGDLFFTIWRDRYIRNLIRNYKFSNQTIRVGLGYLDRNHQYLSLLDTVHYDIYIEFYCHENHVLLEYFKHPFSSLYNSVVVCLQYTIDDILNDGGGRFHKTVKKFEIEYPANLGALVNLSYIPAGVTDLSVNCNNQHTDAEYACTLPPHLKKLSLSGIVFRNQRDDQRMGLPDSLEYLFVSCGDLKLPKIFPSSLNTLHLLHNRLHESMPFIEIPESVSNVKAHGSVDSFSKYKVPFGKVYKDCIISIDSTEELGQLHLFPWVSEVNLSGFSKTKPVFDQTRHLHVKKIHFQSCCSLESLPPLLESLKIYYYNRPTPIGCLPNTLSVLELAVYNKPIPIGLLPQSLTSLRLFAFNYPLTRGALPSGITDLNLMSFNHQLEPYTLPKCLKKLNINGYGKFIDQVNIIPNGLVTLSLNDLTSVSPGTLPSSITQVTLCNIDFLVNHKEILPESLQKLVASFKVSDAQQHFANQTNKLMELPSSITNLSLSAISFGIDNKPIKSPIRIPKSVKHLEISDILIERDLIPDGCFYLSCNCAQPIAMDTLPRSIRVVNLPRQPDDLKELSLLCRIDRKGVRN